MTAEERAVYRLKKRQAAIEISEKRRRRRAESTDWLKKESEGKEEKWKRALRLFNSEKK